MKSSRWRIGYLDGRITAYKELLPFLVAEKKVQVSKSLEKLEKDLAKEVKESSDETVSGFDSDSRY
ncbi:MAG: hypothetical protein HGA54_00885 [Actinobacteria bacterium]|nr:hypothetical protein [Actinomycetota bacterium]